MKPMTIIDFPFISTKFMVPGRRIGPQVFRRDQQHDKQYLDPCHVAT